MNILNLFIVIPLIMLLALWASRNLRQTRSVMVVGSSMLLLLAIYLTTDFIAQRGAGADAEFLYAASWQWYAQMNICY